MEMVLMETAQRERKRAGYAPLGKPLFDAQLRNFSTGTGLRGKPVAVPGWEGRSIQVGSLTFVPASSETLQGGVGLRLPAATTMARLPLGTIENVRAAMKRFRIREHAKKR